MFKALLIGIGGGLAIGGFWTLQDTYPVVAKVIVLVVSIPAIVWAVRKA